MGILKRPGDTSREYDGTGVFCEVVSIDKLSLVAILGFSLNGVRASY